MEICASVYAVKYIHNYIYKGFDKATVEITADGQQQQRDEIDTPDTHRCFQRKNPLGYMS